MGYNTKEILEIFIRDFPDVESIKKAISQSKNTLKKYYQAAIQNKLRYWKKTTKGKLALLLIYDQ